MLRKDQLGNVAFGGAWSERIASDEALTQAMDLIDRRIRDTAEEDLRLDADLLAAVATVCEPNPKGAELKRSFERALERTAADERYRETERIARLMRAWLGSRIGSYRIG